MNKLAAAILTALLTGLLVAASAAPAAACFTEEEVQEILARRDVTELFHATRDVEIESLEIEGDRATAIVAFGDRPRVEQYVYLARGEDGWSITSESYAVPIGMLRRIEAARRR